MHHSPRASDESSEVTRVEQVLAELDDDAVELSAPPADVWLGIAATLASERTEVRATPRTAPVAADPHPRRVEYSIDADDVVTIGAGWSDAARVNRTLEIEHAAPAGTLWDSMSDAETRELWQLIVAHVRRTGTSMTVPIRCDGPDARRWFDMEVEPGTDGHVHFASVLVFEHARDESVDVFDPTIERTAEADELRICGWCGRGEHDQAWFELEELLRNARALEADVMAPLVYGVCGDCRDDLATTVHEHTAAR